MTQFLGFEICLSCGLKQGSQIHHSGLIMQGKGLFQYTTYMKSLFKFFFQFLPDLRCGIFKTAPDFQIPVTAVLKIDMFKNAVQESSGHCTFRKIQPNPV